MRCVSWNCRGLGRPRTVRALKDAIRALSPQLVGLLETKKKVSEWESLKWKLGFRNRFPVSCTGRAGGLALLWDDSLDLHVVSFSQNHIDVIVKCQFDVRVTLFYGDPVLGNRWRTWDLLRRLRDNLPVTLPWTVIGDFNEILCSSESQGLKIRPGWQMNSFRTVLDECNLSDLGYVGYPFTFSNHRMGEAEVKVRLDRAVANAVWRQVFPSSVVSHMHLYVSDHQLIMLDTERKIITRKKRFFRFEAMWLEHPKFAEAMESFWNTIDNNNQGWMDKLRSCKNFLKDWNKASFGNVCKRINKLKEDLEKVKCSTRTEDLVRKEKAITEELDFWLAREETLWMQRSRVLWMKQGDKNTRFFHAKASQRHKNNWIAKLRDRFGVIQEGQGEIMKIVTGYFGDIFRSSLVVNDENLDAQLNCIRPAISKEMNSWLLQDVSEDEIKKAVFSLGPLKAPGVDGFPALFYHKFWDRVKGDVVKEVRKFWTDGVLDEKANRTLIVLIPKKKDADRIEDWRPISLCTVAVKIITKLIATRLQPILSQVISSFQSAFVKGRMITDNFVVAHEIASFLRSRSTHNDFFASVKLDMSKAYDRVEWLFLEKLLLRFGFARSWVEKVMCCIRTVSYQIKVNDKVSSVIRPGRGLRQGDPLSPYLFLLCTELLNTKICDAVAVGALSGIKVCRNAPVVSHLFFADDSIFFLKCKVAEAETLRDILSQYEEASGQRVNFEKSEISFSKNTPADVRRSIGGIFRVPQVSSHSKYLGLPLIIGQRKTEAFRGIVEKVWKRVNDWKGKLLSAAGKEILIKAVLQALPVYTMSVYSVPRKVVDDISKLIYQFWWNKREGNRGISWLNKETLQKKKCDGGLGFKDLRIFNDAILMKVVWRMIKYPQLLMSKILYAKYCPDQDIFRARLGSQASHFWRGVMKTLNIFLEGLRWDESEAAYKWRYTSNGVFSVSSAYDMIRLMNLRLKGGSEEQSDSRRIHWFWRKLWSCNIPNKIKIFNWRVFHNSLPDAVNLRRRGIEVDVSCKVCGCREETAIHVAKDCWWAKALCIEFGLNHPPGMENILNPADWLWWCAYRMSSEDFSEGLVVSWLCWKNRNRVWHGKEAWCVKRAAIIGRSMLYSMQSGAVLNPSANAELTGLWCPPKEGVVKINVDGSWRQEDSGTGIGIVARDHSGSLLWIWAEQLQHLSCAGEVEGHALLTALKIAQERGIEEVMFETDALEVHRAVNLCSDLEAWCISWLGSVLELLRAHPGWSVTFAPRESNTLADGLARKARLQNWHWKSTEAIPLFVVELFS
ncbi:unnamed protein product [Rhodiola kirilowii]